MGGVHGRCEAQVWHGRCEGQVGTESANGRCELEV